MGEWSDDVEKTLCKVRLTHVANVEKSIIKTTVRVPSGIKILCTLQRGALPLPLRHVIHYLLPMNNLLEQSLCTFCYTGSADAENISSRNVHLMDVSGNK